MTTRTFNGSSDFITPSVGALSAIGASTPFTIACICKLADTTDGAIVYLATSTISAGNGNLQLFAGDWYVETAVGHDALLMAASTGDNWTLFAVTKAAGDVTPRGHKYVYGTNTWTHTNGTSTCADGSGTTANVRIGRYAADANYFNGDLAVAGVWNRVLTDLEVEQLAFALGAWRAAGPLALWGFDQPVTTTDVVDLTGGGANQSAITGTTVSAGVPAGFAFGDPLTAQTTQMPFQIFAEMAARRELLWSSEAPVVVDTRALVGSTFAAGSADSAAAPGHVATRTGAVYGAGWARGVAVKVRALGGSVFGAGWASGVAKHVAVRAGSVFGAGWASGVAAKKAAAVGSVFAAAWGSGVESASAARAVVGRLYAAAWGSGVAVHVAVRAGSTSGAAWSSGVARKVMAKGGSVYGAGWARGVAVKRAIGAGSVVAAAWGSGVARHVAVGVGRAFAAAWASGAAVRRAAGRGATYAAAWAFGPTVHAIAPSSHPPIVSSSAVGRVASETSPRTIDSDTLRAAVVSQTPPGEVGS